MIVAVLTGLAALAAITGAGMRADRIARLVPSALVLLLMSAAGLATALGAQTSGRLHAIVVVVGLIAAAVGGGLITTGVFDLVDDRPDVPDRSLRAAGLVLRGGAWVGVLERLAVYATLAARWPAGVAVVLAVKGLGRYPELRSDDNTGLAERFIIGTMVSLLWAALCVYATTGPALR